jgi:L-ascorbate metabolism protein UlaG (beta-lactamase superfamily)
MKTKLNIKIILTIIIIISINMCCSVNKELGKAPSGLRLEKMKMYPNYKDGAFHNLNKNPNDYVPSSKWEILKSKIFEEVTDLKPSEPIDIVKTDIKSLDKNKNLFIWFGHSSYYIQIDGVNFLVDPVFSGAASPLSFYNEAFNATNSYTSEDFPEIDYLLITHDHYDHLDYKTVVSLNSKVKKVICGIGVGSHLEYWGYRKEKISEQYWGDSLLLNNSIKLYTETAHHFSGRFLNRNNTLWVSYVLESSKSNIYIGGDSGYSKHFQEIGKKHKRIDLAILENGQYNQQWRYNHSMPSEVIKASFDLGTQNIIPVHSCKFSLSNHSWYEPLEAITKLNQNKKLNILTPQIGQVLNLSESNKKLNYWWKKYLK